MPFGQFTQASPEEYLPAEQIIAVGLDVGAVVGLIVGLVVGALVGLAVGLAVGLPDARENRCEAERGEAVCTCV